MIQRLRSPGCTQGRGHQTSKQCSHGAATARRVAPTPGWPGGPSPGPRHRLAEQGRTPWAASPASARNEPSLLCLPHVQWEHGHRALQREHFHAPNITTPFTTRHEEDTPLGRPSIKQSEAPSLHASCSFSLSRPFFLPSFLPSLQWRELTANRSF